MLDRRPLGVRMLSNRQTYNRIRPHSSLGYRPPAPEAFVPSGPSLVVRNGCYRDLGDWPNDKVRLYYARPSPDTMLLLALRKPEAS